MIELKWKKDREISGTWYGWNGKELTASVRKERGGWRVEVAHDRQGYSAKLLRTAKLGAARVLSDFDFTPPPNPFGQEGLPPMDAGCAASSRAAVHTVCAVFAWRTVSMSACTATRRPTSQCVPTPRAPGRARKSHTSEPTTA